MKSSGKCLRQFTATNQNTSLYICWQDMNNKLKLYQLHWLPIQERIEFKVLYLTYKALHNMTPLYLTRLLSQKIVLRQLMCKDQHLLQVPLTSLKYAGGRSFQKAAPMLYNALPVTIKTVTSLAVFKKRLKTYLFTKAYMV